MATTLKIDVPAPDNPVKLIMVSGDNNNKYYFMTPHGDTFTVEYGRVDVTKMIETYPISRWASKYKDKIKKGYKDVTKLVKEVSKKATEHKEISDPSVRALFDMLLGFSRNSVKENYSISSRAVTQEQVDEAQSLLDALTNLTSNQTDISIDGFNKILLDYYTVIPRRMNDVRSHLLQASLGSRLDLARKMIDKEQKTLDVMAGQVKMDVFDDSDNNSPEHTILDILGISVECGTSEDEELVRKFMGEDSGELRSVYKVIHTASRDKFNVALATAENKKTDLFWHGSRNENWISILQTGLKIRPSNAVLSGSMFGHGIYFADKYRKSAGYTSLRGSYWARGSNTTAFLALMDVHVGKQYEVLRHNHDCCKFSKDWMKNLGGYDSVFAKGGWDLRNNEYIVYSDDQCSIKYLIQVGK